MTVPVKICGITRPGDADLAARLGAAWVGLRLLAPQPAVRRAGGRRRDPGRAAAPRGRGGGVRRPAGRRGERRRRRGRAERRPVARAGVGRRVPAVPPARHQGGAAVRRRPRRRPGRGMVGGDDAGRRVRPGAHGGHGAAGRLDAGGAAGPAAPADALGRSAGRERGRGGAAGRALRPRRVVGGRVAAGGEGPGAPAGVLRRPGPPWARRRPRPGAWSRSHDDGRHHRAGPARSSGGGTPTRAAISAPTGGASCPRPWWPRSRSSRRRTSRPAPIPPSAGSSPACSTAMSAGRHRCARPGAGRRRSAAPGCSSNARTSPHGPAPHKINNALGQALLAVRMGKRRVVAETGAGQHGVATATALRPSSGSTARSTWGPRTWPARPSTW